MIAETTLFIKTVGLLACPHCGGALHLVEAYFINNADTKHALINLNAAVDSPDQDYIVYGVCDEGEYPGEPADDGRPGAQFWLKCRQCGRDSYLNIRVELSDGSTLLYWDELRPDHPPRRPDAGGSSPGTGNRRNNRWE